MSTEPDVLTDSRLFGLRKKLVFHALPVLFLLGLLLILFADVIRSGMIFGSDIQMEFMGKRAYGFGEMQAGRLALWNPYQFCGYDFHGVFQGAFFYPLNAPFLFFDIHTAFWLTALAHLFLAGIFAYFFLYHLTEDRAAAFASGLLVALNGYILGRVYAGHVTVSGTYPWVIFSLWMFYISVGKSSWAHALYAGVGLGLQVLAGFPLTVFNTVTGLFVYGLLFSRESKFIPRLLKVAGLCLLSGLTGALLSAVQLVPAAVWTGFSTRASGMDYEFAMSNSFPPEGVLTFLAPYFFGDMAKESYWGRWYLWEILPYCGVGGILLFLCSFWTRSPLIRRFALAGIAFLLLSLGKYASFYPLLYDYVPGMKLFRGPSRMLVVLVVTISITAGLMLNLFNKDRDSATKVLSKAWKLALIFAAVLGCVWAVMLIEGRDSLNWRVFVGEMLVLGDRYKDSEDLRSGAFFGRSFDNAVNQLGVATLLLAANAAVFYYGIRHNTTTFRYALIILLGLDLCFMGKRYLEATAPVKPGLPQKIVAAIKGDPPKPDDVRGRSLLPKRIASATNTADLFNGSLDAIAHIGGYDAGMPKRYVQYMNAHTDCPLEDTFVISSTAKPGKLMLMAGVSHVLSTRDKPAYPDSRMVLEDGNYKLYELKSAMPRVYVTHKHVVIPDMAKRFDYMKSKAFMPLDEVVLEKKPAPAPIPFKTTNMKDSVECVSFQAEEVVFKADLAEPGILVLTETFYPGWRAWVDGKEAEILAANHLFRAVALEKGGHEIVFRYSRTIFNASRNISLFSALLLAVLLAGLAVLNKKRTP